MKTHTQRYPSLRRPVARGAARRQALVSSRRLPRLRGRSAVRKAPFLPRTTRHLETTELGGEIGRALVALGGLVAWASVIVLIAG
jgi:hypothetical protein